jgi:hypothetical protein
VAALVIAYSTHSVIRRLRSVSKER